MTVFDDTLRVEVIVTGSDDSPTEGVPADMLRLYAVHDSAYFCEGDTISAAFDTDENGRSEFVIPHVGGHGVVKLISGVAGTYLLKDTVTVVVKSPDFRGDGGVFSDDFQAFGETYQKTCDSLTYNPWFDFDNDCCVGSVDFSEFANHWQHEYTGGGPQGSAPFVAQSQGEVNLVFEEQNPLNGRRTLRAHVSLQNMEPYKSIVIVFQNENPILRFSGWHAQAGYRRPTMAAQVKRDGQTQVLLGVMGGKTISNTYSVDLGYVEFDVLSSDALDLTDDDLALVDATVQELGGAVLSVGESQSQRTIQPPVFTNGLAQNYPNPFNPQTTIAYSIAKSSRVELRIYNVRGQLVETLVEDNQVPNVYRVPWDGRNNTGNAVASGVYFYRLVADDFQVTKKMVLIR